MEKYCLNCVHCVPHFKIKDNPELSACNRKRRDNFLNVCLVIGEAAARKREEEFVFCSAERVDCKGNCGPQGRFFEPKKEVLCEAN